MDAVLHGMNLIPSLESLSPERFETPVILKKLAIAKSKLAELRGVAASLPNQGILINSLCLQEAKDSSAIENIVTTHDELFKEELFPESLANTAAKKILRYRQALRLGFEQVNQSGLLTNNHIIQVQAALEQKHAGYRKLPETALTNGLAQTVLTPTTHETVIPLMRDLERFINDDGCFAADPLIKMALLHYQFETIHPFHDGNGRTGRIINVLYLVKAGLLDIPVLHLSRYIVRTKADYYRRLQAVREQDAWEDWGLYMLTAIEVTASTTIQTIHAIKLALMDAKHRIRAQYRFYSQDLINSLFSHPYTNIEFIERDLKVSRLTATNHLAVLTEGGFLQKHKSGCLDYYINLAFTVILTGEAIQGEPQ